MAKTISEASVNLVEVGDAQLYMNVKEDNGSSTTYTGVETILSTQDKDTIMAILANYIP